VAASLVDRAGHALSGRLSDRSRLRPVLRAIRSLLPKTQRPGSPVEQLISEFAASYPEASFIQVGSNDGVQLDPLRRQVVAARWSGILIEPIPYVFARLRSNYEGHPRVRLENVAISSENGTRELYYIPEATDDSALPPWYAALASFKKDVILQHKSEIPDIADRLATIDVPCMTFDALCAKHGIERVDLIHTDTEGYDFEIIKTIDLARLQPKIVLFEHYHMGRDTYSACIAHMTSAGYDSLAIGMDTICLRRGSLGPKDSRLHRLWQDLRSQPVSPAFRTEVEGDATDG
jgi:FkbM family methyltransferase